MYTLDSAIKSFAPGKLEHLSSLERRAAARNPDTSAEQLQDLYLNEIILLDKYSFPSSWATSSYTILSHLLKNPATSVTVLLDAASRLVSTARQATLGMYVLGNPLLSSSSHQKVLDFITSSLHFVNSEETFILLFGSNPSVVTESFLLKILPLVYNVSVKLFFMGDNNPNPESVTSKVLIAMYEAETGKGAKRIVSVGLMDTIYRQEACPLYLKALISTQWPQVLS